MRLEADIFDQEHREHEGRRAEAVDTTGVEAEIEARHVDDRRQRDVEQPCAHHHHEPDIDDRMRTAEPQRDQRGEAQGPDKGHHADHDLRVTAIAQQDRKQVVLRSDDPGQDDHDRDDADHAGVDRLACRARDPGAAVGLLQPGVGQHAERKAAVPDHVEPDRGLLVGPQQPGRRKSPGKVRAWTTAAAAVNR